MNDNKDFIQETLSKIRDSKEKGKGSNNKKLSRAILFVDVIVILLLFNFARNIKYKTFYHSTKMVTKNYTIRLSATKEKSTKNYLFTLLIKSNINKEQPLIISSPIGTMELTSQGKNIITFHIPAYKKRILLDGNSMVTFSKYISQDIITDLARDKGLKFRKKRKSLISFDKKSITIDALLTTNINRKIYKLSLNFKHEVR